MNYLEYLNSVFPNYEITEEQNINYQNENTKIIIKYLGGGQNFKDSIVQPVQLSFYGQDTQAIMEEVRQFAKAYTTTQFVQKDEYIKQYYSTPSTISQMRPNGNNYNSHISLLGTLIITIGVSDIKQVFIDGYEVETTRRKLAYSTTEDNQRSNGVAINTTQIKSAVLIFTCDMISKNNNVGIKMRRVRNGTLDKNTTFTIKIIYTDNDYTEEYNMRLKDFVIDSDNQRTPILATTFIK